MKSVKLFFSSISFSRSIQPPIRIGNWMSEDYLIKFVEILAYLSNYLTPLSYHGTFSNKDKNWKKY